MTVGSGHPFEGLSERRLAGRRTTTVTGLAARLYLDPGTLSPLLKRLERRGLLERRRADADARVVEVHLTAEGASLRQEALQVPGRVVAASGLGLDEIQRVRAASDAVIAAASRGPAPLR